ncbi:MAG TPA: helix-turn-helix transcriptional regulator [Tepidisphaeraceae bacterium]|nr:helix-turn-helix transcriptional regulator [Tepidisphaeraceae bacterium]
MADRVVSSSLSADVIELLTKRGMTLAAIAEAIGVTRSFLSRVKGRSRSLTIDHLVALEAVIGEPLPLLLLRATPIEAVPKDLRPLYRSTTRVVRGYPCKTKPRTGRSSKVIS